MKTIYQLLGCATAAIFSLSSFAQSVSPASPYRNAVGIRAGETSGLTYKHIISSGRAVEIIAGGWWNGFSVTGLYELYRGAGAQGLYWYYGGGAHIASYYDYRSIRHYSDRRYRHYHYHSEDGLGIGVDGIVGIEYKIQPIPIAVSLDIKPFVELNTMGGAYIGFDPGLGIKFTF